MEYGFVRSEFLKNHSATCGGWVGERAEPKESFLLTQELLLL